MGHWDMWKCVTIKKKVKYTASSIGFIHYPLEPTTSLLCTSGNWEVCKAPRHLYFLVTYSVNTQLNFFLKGVISSVEKGQTQAGSETPKKPPSQCDFPLCLSPNGSCSHHQSSLFQRKDVIQTSNYLYILSDSTRNPQPPPALFFFLSSGFEGFTVYNAVCAVFSSWRAARGHATADLLTEGKR